MEIYSQITSNNSIVEEPLSCPEKPSENYDSLLGDEMLFYKNKGSDGLGLCYSIDSADSCNCNPKDDKECDDTLWSENTLTIGGDAEIKLCCSTRRINDPSIRCSKPNEDGDQQCTKENIFFSNNCNNSQKDVLPVDLQSGTTNFERYSGEQVNRGEKSVNFSNEFDKCKVNSISDMEGRKVCLLHLTSNPKELCPNGWKYNGKLNTQTYDNKNVNICCKNL